MSSVPVEAGPSDAAVPFNSYTPRVAIVTGGAQGIGYAVAHRLVDDGVDVAINDLSEKQKQIDAVVEELIKKGRRSIAVPGDVSSEADVAAVVAKTVDKLGSVDIMIANAGVAPFIPILETSVEAFDRAYAINARGVFLSFKHAALQMVKQGRGGRLIAASSLAGKQGPKNMPAYSASKFAVRGILQSAALELRKYGITANGYAPGAIVTPLVTGPDGASDDLLKLCGYPPDTPFGQPEDIASIVGYLAKPESYFITGQTITVDGGIHFD